MVWPLNPIRNLSVPALPNVYLQGTNVFIRPPKLQDWPKWAKIRGANKDRLKPYEPLWAENSLDEDFFKIRLSRQLKEWEQDHARPFLIFKTKDHSLIGGININHICKGAAQYASLGYWIDAEHEGHGYMREALNMILHYCFTEMQLHRMNAACLPENKSSHSLLKGAGFSEEGFAPRYLHINGEWRDHVLFGLCAEDYTKPYHPQRLA